MPICEEEKKNSVIEIRGNNFIIYIENLSVYLENFGSFQRLISISGKEDFNTKDLYSSSVLFIKRFKFSGNYIKSLSFIETPEKCI